MHRIMFNLQKVLTSLVCASVTSTPPSTACITNCSGFPPTSPEPTWGASQSHRHASGPRSSLTSLGASRNQAEPPPCYKAQHQSLPPLGACSCLLKATGFKNSSSTKPVAPAWDLPQGDKAIANFVLSIRDEHTRWLKEHINSPTHFTAHQTAAQTACQVVTPTGDITVILKKKKKKLMLWSYFQITVWK